MRYPSVLSPYTAAVIVVDDADPALKLYNDPPPHAHSPDLLSYLKEG